VTVRAGSETDRSDTSLVYLSVAEASEEIASGRLSPVELLTAVFERIAATDSALNAYVLLMRESAIEGARAAERRARSGQRLGPLDGIPIALKDLFDTGGVVTAGGTGAFRDRVPEADATAVRRLREAGAVITGKTNTHELALGGTTNNVHYGATHNPWKLGHVPGGSSGGSGAAVAAGQCLAALGTDTAGSIRIPAAFCGVTGLKPTYGLVGRGGVIPLALTLDHAGPIARSALDCALLLNVLAGHDPRDYDSIARRPEDFTASIDAGVRGLRFAVIPSLVEGCIEAVRRNFEASLSVLRDLGAEITTAEPMGDESEWRDPLEPLIVAEGAAWIEHILRHRPETIGEPVRKRFAAGLSASATAYARALHWRKHVQASFEQTLRARGLHAYLAPTCPYAPEPITPDPHTDAAPPAKFRNTSVFDYSHQPSLTVPNGLDEEGLPTGLMISSGLWHDALVLRIGHAYQQATDFQRQRPRL
jgi:aspartyl-tRNA(Asn)/glutamyl-tRNA(Gln) amidotransferase subunit A